MCVFRDYKDEIEQITSDPRFDMISQELENNIKCYKSFEINKFENLLSTELAPVAINS